MDTQIAINLDHRYILPMPTRRPRQKAGVHCSKQTTPSGVGLPKKGLTPELLTKDIMKKRFNRAGLVTATILAATGPAQAQSSVTLFGVVDATVRNVRGEGNGRLTSLTNSGLSSNRLGFRGAEDLGGGLKANFHLEGSIAVDTGLGGTTNTNNQTAGATAAGGLIFDRRATLSLSGGWGEFSVGRDIVPSYGNTSEFDPFGTRGVGSTNNLNIGQGVFNVATTVRASNSLSYFTPALGGFYGHFMYALGENASNATATGVGVTPGAINTSDDGQYFGGRFGYKKGPLHASLGAGRTTYTRYQTALAPYAAAAGDYSTWNTGASYDFGFLTLMGAYNHERRELLLAPGTAAEGRSNSFVLGVTVPVGAGQVRAAFTTVKQNAAAGNNQARQLAVGYAHNLSKRTAAYVNYAQVDNKRGRLYHNGRATSVGGGNTSGLDIGLRHSF